MKHVKTGSKKGLFQPLLATASVQAAMMTLKPGQASGDEIENEHPRAEQWLFVIAGSGRATVGRRAISIKAGSLLLIEKGEPHRIVNTGDEALSTINFYSPPAYTDAGDVKPGVKKK